MADYCCKKKMQELDDVHRLLPPEILKDIGITNADDQRLTAVVEELSSRLAAVLGAAMNNGSQHRRRLSPPWPTTNPYHHHRTPQPQHYYMLVDDGNNATAPRAEAWRSMSNGGTMLDMASCLPRFAPAPRPLQVLHGVPPPANHGNGNRGTGVFLPPRAQAYHHTAKPPRMTGRSTDAKPRCGKQQCRQQQRRQLHFHGDRAVLLAAAQEQARNRSAASAASHGCRDELGLPQEWIY